MPQIFELFGYPISDQSEEAQLCRQAAHCPFMGQDCDGGGNRYQTMVSVKRDEILRRFFGDRTEVPVGICSIQLNANEAPWIVCPRRLLYLKSNKAQRHIEQTILSLANYPSGTRLGLWREVRVHISADNTDNAESVVQGSNAKDTIYTFDYIIMPIENVALESAAKASEWTETDLRRHLRTGSYEITVKEGLNERRLCVVDFPKPDGIPLIVEVMTSSTSGGGIPKAFENAVKRLPHDAPSINYRQVWARMVSQLIAKSEVALSWGGICVWVLQDVLANYISSTTALDIFRFESEKASEVNILTVSYDQNYVSATGILRLGNIRLFAGPIGKLEGRGFLDIVRLAAPPRKSVLFRALARRRPQAMYVVS